jgi:hypothetical protein
LAGSKYDGLFPAADPEPTGSKYDDLFKLPDYANQGTALKASDVGLDTPTTLPGTHAGLITPGNIDLTTRPDTANPDGSHSSVRSASFNFDGKETLVPTVADDGRVMTDDEAATQYQRTGRHLGQFQTPEHANAYADQLHRQQAGEFNTANVRGAANLGPVTGKTMADTQAAIRSEAEGDQDVTDPEALAAGQRMVNGTATYADKVKAMPQFYKPPADEARDFLQFAGAGAAGELAAPLIARGVGSAVDRARAIQAARAAREVTKPIVRDPAALAPVEMGPPLMPRPDFWVPQDGDQGDALFETPSTAERTANIRLPGRQ